MNAIDTWIAIHADNTATVYIGKGEFGQGDTTGLLQIAAEELDLDMSQVRSVQLDTNVVPNQGATVSSASIERGGPQIRAAAAEARRALLNLASTRLAMQVGSLVVNKGVVSIDGHPTQSVSYGALLGDKPFNVKFTGTAPQKAITRYKVVGTNVPRVDIPEKAAGTYTHMQHVRLPGMLHGRVVRPRGQRAYGVGAKPMAIDEASIKDIPARIVRKGDFVGVVAENEWDAIRAARALKVTWQETSALPGNADLFTRMRAAKTSDVTIVNWGDAEKAFAKAAHVSTATYYCPYQSHAPFGPNCAIGDVGAERRAGDLLDPGHLRLARHAGGGAWPAGQQGARAICRRLGHLRPKLLRGLRPGRGGDVASGRQAGARAVHALRRARLGRLRPGASRRRARRHRRQRQDRGLPVQRLAARLADQRDDARARAQHAAEGAHHAARCRSRSTA